MNFYITYLHGKMEKESECVSLLKRNKLCYTASQQHIVTLNFNPKKKKIKISQTSLNGNLHY